jgi:short-subunit dehydrogenase
MAVVLARDHGANVIAVARRMDRLDALRAELKGTFNVQVHAIAADLSRAEDVERVVLQASEDHKLYAAILNAGLTYYGDHFGLAWNDFQTMLAVNVVANVRLTTALLTRIEQDGEEGGVMLVASLAGITPVPYQTAYSSTKAFLVHFGCGLWHELQGRKVSITTYAPGGIDTPMTAGPSFGGLRRWLVPVEGAARDGIEALRMRAYLHVPGALSRVGLVIAKFLPAHFVTGRVGAAYRRSLETAAQRLHETGARRP